MHQKKIFDGVWWFHGHKCAMSLIGAKAGLYLLDLMKEERKGGWTDLFAVVEDYSCMIDGLQYVTGCTIGNQTLFFHNHFFPAVTMVRKSTKEGYKLTLKPEIVDEVVKARKGRDQLVAKKYEMGPEEFMKKIKPFQVKLNAIADKYTDVSYTELFTKEKVKLDWRELAKIPLTKNLHE
ncbi:MAG: FmdE family protein [Candidatus Ranarchaeia archaeon]